MRNVIIVVEKLLESAYDWRLAPIGFADGWAVWFVKVGSKSCQDFALSQWKEKIFSLGMKKAGREIGLGRNIKSL